MCVRQHSITAAPSRGGGGTRDGRPTQTSNTCRCTTRYTWYIAPEIPYFVGYGCRSIDFPTENTFDNSRENRQISWNIRQSCRVLCAMHGTGNGHGTAHLGHIFCRSAFVAVVGVAHVNVIIIIIMGACFCDATEIIMHFLSEKRRKTAPACRARNRRRLRQVPSQVRQ